MADRIGIRDLIFRRMLLLVLAAAALRLVIWLAYATYEARLGHVVLYKEINEFLILLVIDFVTIPLIIYLLLRITLSVTRPLGVISKAAEDIQQGKLSARIDAAALPAGEIAQVAEGLNKAFDTYNDINRRMAEFTSDASHQLRTPLTAIRSAAEVAALPDQPSEIYLDALHAVIAESERLSRMVEQLFMLTRLEQEELSAAYEEVELGELLKKVEEDFGPAAQSIGVGLTVECEDSVHVRASPSLLYELLANLVDNALKASTENGRIRLRLERKGRFAEIQVHDSGRGIPADDRPRIFERFYRPARETGEGSGLGLAICKEIVKVHGGTICLMESPLGGTGFCIQLPRFEPELQA